MGWVCANPSDVRPGNPAFLKITSVHELMKQGISSFYQAHKDTLYRFKNGEWSWRPFYWRFIRHLGSKLQDLFHH
jgi:hypothetical protein